MAGLEISLNLSCLKFSELLDSVNVCSLIKFRNFWAVISLNIFSVLIFLLSFWDSSVKQFYIVLQIAEAPFFFFFGLCSLYSIILLNFSGLNFHLVLFCSLFLS